MNAKQNYETGIKSRVKHETEMTSELWFGPTIGINKDGCHVFTSSHSTNKVKISCTPVILFSATASNWVKEQCAPLSVECRPSPPT